MLYITFQAVVIADHRLTFELPANADAATDCLAGVTTKWVSVLWDASCCLITIRLAARHALTATGDPQAPLKVLQEPISPPSSALEHQPPFPSSS